jgi:hypothetical protein
MLLTQKLRNFRLKNTMPERIKCAHRSDKMILNRAWSSVFWEGGGGGGKSF